jgi:WD40 repeat protein
LAAHLSSGNPKLISFPSFSPDSKIVVAGDDFGQVWIWENFKSPEKICIGDVRIEREPEAIASATFSPDGKILAALAGRKIVFLSAGNWKQIAAIQTDTTFFNAVFSADGASLLVGCWDGYARIWNVTTRELLAEFQHNPNKHVHAVAFLDDEQKIMTASCNETLRIWDARTAEVLAEFKGPEDLISAAVSDDSQAIAAASRDGTTWIFRQRRPEPWWGIAWLPEFWVMIVLAAALGGNLWREARMK